MAQGGGIRGSGRERGTERFAGTRDGVGVSRIQGGVFGELLRGA